MIPPLPGDRDPDTFGRLVAVFAIAFIGYLVARCLPALLGWTLG